jgi:hypothetical protein
MRNKTGFSASVPSMGGLLLAVICAAAILTPANAQSWAHASPASSPSARVGHAMAYDSVHGQVVLFGGQDINLNYLGDTWVWDGINWTQKSPGTSPPVRLGHAMAYDAAHGQVVLFGGHNYNNNYLGDTWVWDGTNWTQKSPGTSPTARVHPAMAYDSVHGQVVLFGGSNGSYLGDTWVWDGTNWTQKLPGISPPARHTHAMAYDAAHALVVLFAGYNGSFLGDTWVWNGTTWTQKLPSTSPPARSLHAMAYDAVHGQAVLFGGFNGGGLGDTWLWDGTNWSQNLSSPSPPARWVFAMAYDAAHQQVVLFGGWNNGNYLSDTWLWEGGFSVSPNSGSGTGPQVFTAVYFDTKGASDLQAVYLDFGSVGFAAHNCIAVYAPGTNSLYLFNDDNSGAFGPITEGAGGGSVSNSQCKLSSGTTAATMSGNNLIVPFTIQFLAGYGGLKQIFGLAQSYDGTQSNGGVPQDLGTWEPAPSTPTAVSVSPNSGSGLTQVFTAAYSDTGGANDLQVVYLSFGSSFLAANSCNVGYEPGNNTLFLLSDNNATIATVGEGGLGSVSNSQCILSGGVTPATESGTGLTVPFTITFKITFTGAKTVFGLAQTYDGTQSAVTTLGSWTP